MKIFSLRKAVLAMTISFCVVAGAQDKVMELKLDKKHRLLNNFFTKNGLCYVVTGNDRLSKTELNYSCYDENFNLKFSTKLQSKYKSITSVFRTKYNTMVPYDWDLTPTGKNTIMYVDDLVIDENGNAKGFDLDEGKKMEDFDTKFYIYSDDYACYFGYKKDETKKAKVSDETYFYQVDLKTLQAKLIELKFPEFPLLIKNDDKKKSKEKEIKQEWELARHDEKNFYMINKKTSIDRTEDQYNIVCFDYDGKVVSTLSIPMKLKSKYFALANTGFGSQRIIVGQNAGIGLLGDSATGHIFVDENKEFYYVYGLYSNAKMSNLNKVNYNGFYIHKYNVKGELVWKTEKSIVDSGGLNKTQRPLAVTVMFFKLKNNQIGFNISSWFEKYAHMYLLDSNDGKIVKNKS